MAKPTWKHAFTTSYSKGQRRVQCCCGKQSPKNISDSEISEWVEAHRKTYGLVERTPKRIG